MTADELAALIEAGEDDLVRAALTADPTLLDAHTVGGETPLHVACRTKMAGIVTVLVARNADVNARDAGGRTPLHSAVLGGGSLGPTLVDLLLTFGADPNAVDAGGQSVEELARIEQVIGVDLLVERLRRS